MDFQIFFAAWCFTAIIGSFFYIVLIPSRLKKWQNLDIDTLAKENLFLRLLQYVLFAPGYFFYAQLKDYVLSGFWRQYQISRIYLRTEALMFLFAAFQGALAVILKSSEHEDQWLSICAVFGTALNIVSICLWIRVVMAMREHFRVRYFHSISLLLMFFFQPIYMIIVARRIVGDRKNSDYLGLTR